MCGEWALDQTTTLVIKKACPICCNKLAIRPKCVRSMSGKQLRLGYAVQSFIGNRTSRKENEDMATKHIKTIKKSKATMRLRTLRSVGAPVPVKGSRARMSQRKADVGVARLASSNIQEVGQILRRQRPECEYGSRRL